jgi:hypothetical protein
MTSRLRKRNIHKIGYKAEHIESIEYRMPVAMRRTAVLIPYRPQALSALIRPSNVSNSIQNCPHFGVLMRQLGYAITEDEMAYISRETEEFDQETLHILGNALDEAWRRVKSNHLNGRAYGARTVLAQHIFAMAKQGERDPHRLIDGALMRLTL